MAPAGTMTQTARGPVKGVTGKRAIHLMDEADRKKVPEIHEMWIDIGAKDGDEARGIVRVGDDAIVGHGPVQLLGSRLTSRALDDRRRQVFETHAHSERQQVFDGVHDGGYVFQIEMTWRASRAGARVREIPIIFRDRRVGQSKMSRRIVVEALLVVLRLRLAELRGEGPR